MSIQTIINQDESGVELVNFARQTADQLVKNNLTRSQIRTIFTEMRKIEALWDSKPKEALRRLNILKYKIDYQTSRTPAMQVLRDVLTAAIDEVGKATTDEKRNISFRRFVELFEAILAYHRVRGGKN